MLKWTDLSWDQIVARVRAATAPQILLLTGTGSFYRLPGIRMYDVHVGAPGGPGGSGRRGAAGSVRSGGAGGGSGGYSFTTVTQSDMPPSLSYSVGVPGAGGTAITVDNTNGNAGSASSKSWIGFSATDCLAAATAGSPGAGGTAVAAAGGAAGRGQVPGAAGASSSATGLAGTNGTAAAMSASGPSGGGLTAANATSAGGTGAVPLTTIGRTAPIAGAAGGLVLAGTGGNPLGFTQSPAGGWSPGGGGSSTANAASNGGALPGFLAGGAGGGASTNGFASGAGSPGGPGFLIVIAYY